jgi:hypothetical protein
MLEFRGASVKRALWCLVLAADLLAVHGCKERGDGSSLRNDDADSPESGQAAPAPSNAQLDTLYGVAYPPGYYKLFETNPDGTTIRNPGLQTCVPPHQLLTANHDIHQIWAILKDGTLVLGDEVVVGTDANGKEEALGHPTLTAAGAARIAGELRWNSDNPFINNKSGRYSEHPDRGPTQLTNAAALFHTCGLDVQTQYFHMPMHPPEGVHTTPFGPSDLATPSAPMQ